MNSTRKMLMAVLALAWSLGSVQAGGSGLNVAVVVNQHSTNSVQLGNYYCERRQVPPQNLVRIHWPGSKIEWSKTDFETHLLQPLTNALADRGLSGQIEFVLLSMDIPYRVIQSGTATNSGANSTTSVLFYGFKPDEDPGQAGIPDSCSLPEGSTNPYSGSELPFRTVTNDNAWLAFMLTATNLASAKAIVDRGVASDGSFPTQSVFLTKSTDTARNVRYLTFDNAILDNLVLGRMKLARTNVNTPTPLGRQLGSHAGWMVFPMTTNLFVPGAMADNLTSFGGKLFESTGHTGVTNYLTAGATASYGTVVEPCNWLEKFPSPQNYFYQARGFSIAECYYQSLTNPFQGILVGEPLAAPFAAKPAGVWLGLPSGAELSGVTNLTLQITAASGSRPVDRVDLFVDGAFWQTITNLPPREGNVLNLQINGHSISYPVPAGATLKSVTSGLTAEINRPQHVNPTGVRAFAHGDRVELQSAQFGRPGSQVIVSAGSAAGSAPGLTTFIAVARNDFLDTVAWGRRNFAVKQPAADGSFLQLSITKTNGNNIAVTVTNAPGNTNTALLVQALVNAVNTHADLTPPDGLIAEDFIASGQTGGEFNLRARRVGWPESQISVSLTGSANLDLSPPGTPLLDENLADLRPRNHLHLTSGATNLTFAFAMDTTILPDGDHELTAVAYEGSHVRTQQRAAQHVRLTNSPLSATLRTLVGGSNTLAGTVLQFAVTANTNAGARIELFSTGGLLASLTNQASATFSVAGTNLDLGLHPFYAVVTRNDGQQCRTKTEWIRLVDNSSEAPFRVIASGPPPTLSWPAVVGRTYEVFHATNLADALLLHAAFPATNSAARWVETATNAAAHFYRVRSSP